MTGVINNAVPINALMVVMQKISLIFQDRFKSQVALSC